jgi:lipoic acid synthetase
MLLGHTCTRGCRFCAVTTGNPRGAVDPREPEHVARAISSLGLKYVVLTMVDRDDLLDGGAAHVAQTIASLHGRQPSLLVEALVGDFNGRHRDVDVVLDGRPDVYAHNVEVPRRLTPIIRDQRCSYDRSLDVLRHAKDRAPEHLTKSSVMVGVGETDDEVLETLADLRGAGVDVVTIGQYLRPTPKHAPVDRYVEPSMFDEFERAGMSLGFAYVASGPLVRSSYHAAEAFMATRLGGASAERAPSAPAVNGSDGSSSLEASRTPSEQLISPSSLVRART